MKPACAFSQFPVWQIVSTKGLFAPGVLEPASSTSLLEFKLYFLLRPFEWQANCFVCLQSIQTLPRPSPSSDLSSLLPGPRSHSAIRLPGFLHARLVPAYLWVVHKIEVQWLVSNFGFRATTSLINPHLSIFENFGEPSEINFNRVRTK